jgi:S1-C subfamily serine protease
VSNRSNETLSPSAAAVGLSVALIVLFAVCALAQLIAPGLQATHAWVGLFTTAPVLSFQAWIEGIVFSAVFGAIAGTIFVLVYNAVIVRSR